MNFTTKIVAWVAILVALAALGTVVLTNGGPTLGGTTNFDSLSLSEDLTVTDAATVGSLTLDTGSTINEHNCGTNTAYDPPSLANLATTTKDVAVTGAAVGDLCIASLSSATGTEPYVLSCNITGSATATVSILNTSGLTVNNPTGTLRACYFGY